MREKCSGSPQFSPHPPHDVLLTYVDSINSEWHSCLFKFLPAHRAAKSWGLNGLQKPTSCVREIHLPGSTRTRITSARELVWLGVRLLNGFFVRGMESSSTATFSPT